MNLKQLYHTQEGKILFLGILLCLLCFISLAFSYFYSFEFASKMVGMIGTNLLFGRAAGLSFGYAVEFSHLTIIVVNILIETILVLLIYPLFIFSYQNLIHIHFLEHFFKKVKALKIKHHKLFHRYGVYGLFLFVWLPFWMTGPVVGAIIGFLIGLRHFTIISSVILGTSVAIMVWAYFLNELTSFLLTFGSSALWVFFIVILLVILILKLNRHTQSKD